VARLGSTWPRGSSQRNCGGISGLAALWGFTQGPSANGTGLELYTCWFPSALAVDGHSFEVYQLYQLSITVHPLITCSTNMF
jgi:hypothetical protein